MAPVNGVISALFQTGHAVGITAETNEEILIHIGMDTVQLNGRYFYPRVKQGDSVKKGDVLLEFDLQEIKKAGYEIASPVVITNKNDYMDIFAINERAKVEELDAVLAVLDK